MAHDIRDELVDFVRRWSEATQIACERLTGWVGISSRKYRDWRGRYGKANENNGLVPHDHWLEPWERQESLGGLFQFGPDRLVGIELGRLLDQDVSEIREEPPIPLFVGVGQSAARRGLANAAVIELGAQGPEAGFDIAQALAVGELGEGQHQEMLVAGQRAHMLVAGVTANTLVELVFGQFVHQLGKHRSALIHNRFLPRKCGQEPCETAFQK